MGLPKLFVAKQQGEENDARILWAPNVSHYSALSFTLCIASVITSRFSLIRFRVLVSDPLSNSNYSNCMRRVLARFCV